MNIKQAAVCLSVLAGSAIAFSATSAQAFTFQNGNPAEVGGTCAATLLPPPGTHPTTCTTGDGFQLIANPVGKFLESKNVNGVVGVGISGTIPADADAVFGEIDQGEFLHLIAPTSNTVFGSLGLSFLYVDKDLGLPNFGDENNEIALVDVFGAGDVSLGQGVLKVLNDGSTAEWTFDGITKIINGNFTANGPGYANIVDPFGNKGIHKLVLKVNNPGDNAIYNDFALVNASTGRVPEPATIAGLGVVAAGLAVSRRRRQNSK